MEVLRMKNVAPITPLHRAVRDTQLQGYTIPKVTCFVLIQFSKISNFLLTLL